MFENCTRLVSCAAVGLSLILLVGCNPQAIRKTEYGGQEKGRVLAVVNGSALTTDDFEKDVNRLPSDLKPLAHTAEGKVELLESMIVRELIRQETTTSKTGRSRALVTSSKPYELFQEIRDELMKSASIIMPEEDGVDAGDEENLKPQQIELLRNYLCSPGPHR